MNRQLSPKARERKLRARYRRNLRIAVILSLIIGAAIGFVVGQYVTKTHVVTVNPAVRVTATPDASLSLSLDGTPEPTAAPVITAEPTAQPTAVPTPTPTPVPTPTPAPQVVVIPFGSTGEISAQIHNDGSVRRTIDAETYETLSFTLEVKRYLTPEYYEENYATKYQMQGNEAGVEFELTLNDYTGTQTITPQDLFTIGLETIDGDVETGFQLTDAEIHGDNKVTIDTNIPKMFYKRFKFSQTIGDMDYLSVTGIVDGIPTTWLFELGDPIRPTPSPVPETTYAPISIGEKSDAVKKLQEALIEEGYLSGAADGHFGGMTEEAVKAAQTALGQTVTGVADHDLQQALYAE